MSIDNYMQQVADEAEHDYNDERPEPEDALDWPDVEGIMEDYETLETVARWMNTDEPF